jgi:Mg2+-importing ATPase
MTARNAKDVAWGALPVERLAQVLGASPNGLGAAEAAERLERHGPNTFQGAQRSRVLSLLWRQLGSPIVLILIAATCISFFVRDAADGTIILIIVFASAMLGFWQEYRASSALAGLQQLVAVQASVLRDGVVEKVPLEDVVPGDVVVLAAGSSIPADCRLLEARDLFVNEASLTGETFPVEKRPGDLPADTPLARRANALFQGTHVASGTGRALVVRTGRETEFGGIADRLRLRPAETDFEHGVRRFGILLIRVTMILMTVIFAFNVYLRRPVLDSFLFSLALAVGLTPELLPAIISVNLASGARRMSARKVIVKRLASIENFGTMDVLCSDKTGTLTEGKVRLSDALDVEGSRSSRTLRLAGINAAFQTGFANPIDEAVVATAGPPPAGTVRRDEIPYDFTRKRLSVLAATAEAGDLLITKGALEEVLEVCTHVDAGRGEVAPVETHRRAIEERYADFSARGLRTLGIATKALPGRATIARDDECDMTFMGFLLFADPPKTGMPAIIEELRNLGVRLKIITGDNELVARAVAEEIGLPAAKIVSGETLRQASDDALPRLAVDTDIFADIEPNQKERIIRAVRKAGGVVGYMGDGINDAPALHAADVGLSVQGAADVAKDAADIVLLEADLAVLADGVREGRRTFANTQKYVFMATSANFGNMFSMAGASLLLPFLPLLPKQILLTNLMTDMPEMTIATDRVDDEAVRLPRRWDVRFIRRFMVRFGLLSSMFDLLTFVVLYFVLHASPEVFRSGWFVESVVSAASVVLVLRTRGPFWRSRPSLALGAATVGAVVAAVALPYTPVRSVFAFAPLPMFFLALMGLIVVAYAATVEIVKRAFYRGSANSGGARTPRL